EQVERAWTDPDAAFPDGRPARAGDDVTPLLGARVLVLDALRTALPGPQRHHRGLRVAAGGQDLEERSNGAGADVSHAAVVVSSASSGEGEFAMESMTA